MSATLEQVDPELAAKVQAVQAWAPGAVIKDRYDVRWITLVGGSGVSAVFVRVDDIASSNGTGTDALTAAVADLEVADVVLGGRLGAVEIDLPTKAAATGPRWQPLGEPGPGGAHTDLSVSPFDGQRVLLAGDVIGIALSEDGGLSWQTPTTNQYTDGAGNHALGWEFLRFTWHPRNPKEVWCGSRLGPWKSSDGGRSWSLQRGGMPNLSAAAYTAPVEQVWFDPANSAHMLAFGGDHRQNTGGYNETGFGKVWESFDGGDTWAGSWGGNSTGLPADGNILCHDYDAAASTHYVAVLNGGIWKITDAAIATHSAWTKVLDAASQAVTGATGMGASAGLVDFANVQWLYCSRTTAGTLWAALSASSQKVSGSYIHGTIVKSTDSGATWALAAGGLPAVDSASQQAACTQFHTVTVLPDGTTLWTGDSYGGGGANHGLWKSVDGGTTWTFVDTQVASFYPGSAAEPGGTSLYHSPLAFDPRTPTSLWFGTNDTTYHSDDGGTTWRDQSNVVAADGSVRGRGFSGLYPQRIAVSPYVRNTLYVLGLDSSNMLVTRDRGGSWEHPTWAWDPYFGGHDIDFGGTYGEVVWAPLGQTGFHGIAHSTDGGLTFEVIAGNAVAGPGGQVSVAETGMRNDGAAFVGGSPGLKPFSVAIVSTDGAQVLAVVGDGNVYRRYNPGGGYQWQITFPSARGFAVGLAVDGLGGATAGSGALFRTRLIGTANGVFMSTDSGATWGDGLGGSGAVAGSPTGVTRIVQDPSQANIWWLTNYGVSSGAGGISSGLFKFDSLTRTFTRMIGVGPVAVNKTNRVHDVAVDPFDSNRVLCVANADPTSDVLDVVGAFLSEDGGVTWTAINDGLQHTRIWCCAFDSWDEGRVLIGTAGRGAFQAQLPTALAPQTSEDGLLLDLATRFGLSHGDVARAEDLRRLADAVAALAADAGESTASEFEITFLTKAFANTNFTTFAQLSSNYLGGSRASGGAQNDSVTFLLPHALTAGTWTLVLAYLKGAANGIFTIATSVDGTTFTDVGTIDSYNATTTNANRTEITGVTIPEGTRYIRLKMATKNEVVPSGGYTGKWSGLFGVRTGA